MSLSAPEFRHGKDTCLYLNGIDISEFFKSVEFPDTKASADSTGFRQRRLKRKMGHLDGTVSAEGMGDFDANSLDAVLDDAIKAAEDGATSGLIWLPGGEIVGDIGYATLMGETNYTVSGGHDDIVACSIEGETDVGRDRVRILQAKGDPETATGVGGTVSDGAGISTAFGGVGYLQVFSETGTGSLAVTINDSSDAFAMVDNTIVTFDSVADTVITTVPPVGNHQRKLHDSGLLGTVLEELRSDFTFTVITGAEFFVGFKRGLRAGDYEEEVT